MACMGTSGCYLLNSNEDIAVPGVLGRVDGGILPVAPPTLHTAAYRLRCSASPQRRRVSIASLIGLGRSLLESKGMIGYELGQPAMGDAFSWLNRVTGQPLSQLAEDCAVLPATRRQHGGQCTLLSPRLALYRQWPQL